MGTVLRLWQTNRIALLAFMLVSGLALFFAVRFTMSVIYWNDPRHLNQPLEGWMTIGYIAQSYGVPPEKLAEELGFTRRKQGGRPLDKIAVQRGMTSQELQQQITAVLATMQRAPSR